MEEGLSIDQLCLFTRDSCGALGIELPLRFSYRALMCCANIPTFVLENCVNGTIIVLFRGWWICLEFLFEFDIHKWDTLKSLILKFAAFHVSSILYKCWVFTLEENNGMSGSITPDCLPPEEKFAHGLIRVIPFKNFGDWAMDPRKLAGTKIPLFEGLLPEGLSEAYRAWKRQKRVLKPSKRWATFDSKRSKKLPDPRFDLELDPKDPSGLSCWSLILKSVNKKIRFDFQVA